MIKMEDEIAAIETKLKWLRHASSARMRAKAYPHGKRALRRAGELQWLKKLATMDPRILLSASPAGTTGKGAGSPYILVERTKDGRCVLVLLTIWILVNQVRESRRPPGAGPVIDGATAERRSQIRSALAPIYSAALLGRTDQNRSSQRLRPAGLLGTPRP